MIHLRTPWRMRPVGWVLSLGPALWLDPYFGLYQERTGALATIPAVSNGDPVGTWRARTGQNFVADSDPGRPSFVASPRAVRFAIGLHLIGGNLSALTPTAATLAVRVWHDPAATGQNHEYFMTRGNDSYSRFTGGGSYPGQFRTSRVENQPIFPFGWSTAITRSDSTAWTRRLNGVQDITTAAQFNAGDDWRLARGLGGADKFLAGYIASLMVFPRVLTDSECVKLEQYLATKGE